MSDIFFDQHLKVVLNANQLKGVVFESNLESDSEDEDNNDKSDINDAEISAKGWKGDCIWKNDSNETKEFDGVLILARSFAVNVHSGIL